MPAATCKPRSSYWSAPAALAPEETAERLALMLKLGHALFEIGDFARAEALLSDTEKSAAALGDRSIELRAGLDRSYLRTWTTPQGNLEELREVAERAIPALEEIADDAGLARGWRNLATVQFFECRFGSAAESLERALQHAENTSDQQLKAEMLPGLAVALSAGPVPVDKAIQRIETLLQQFGPEPGSEHAALTSVGTRAAVEAWGLAGLEAMRGRFAAARALCSRAKSVFREVGQRRRLADAGFYSGLIEKLAGVPQDAERELRLSYDTLEQIGETALLSTVAAELAEAIHLQGRAREAEQLTEESERLAVDNDVESQVRWRIARAKLFAGRGDLDAGRALAQEAVRRSSAVEFPNLQAGALVALAEIEAASGHSAEAKEIASKALDLYRAKGNLVSEATVETFLAQLPRS